MIRNSVTIAENTSTCGSYTAAGFDAGCYRHRRAGANISDCSRDVLARLSGPRSMILSLRTSCHDLGAMPRTALFLFYAGVAVTRAGELDDLRKELARRPRFWRASPPNWSDSLRGYVGGNGGIVVIAFALLLLPLLRQQCSFQ